MRIARELKTGLALALVPAIALVLAGCAKRSPDEAKESGGEATRRAGAPGFASTEAAPVIRLTADGATTGISFLSWDTEGGAKAAANLLRAGSAVRIQCLALGGAWADAKVVGRRLGSDDPKIIFLTVEAGK